MGNKAAPVAGGSATSAPRAGGPSQGEGKSAKVGQLYLQVMSSGSWDVPAGLLLFCESAGKSVVYLLNCGEGTQRFSTEHKLRIPSRLQRLFATRVSWDAIGGLPGILLTMNDATRGAALNVHGPSGVEPLLRSFRHFMSPAAMPRTVHTVSDAVEHYLEESGIRLTPLVLCPSAASLWTRLAHGGVNGGVNGGEQWEGTSVGDQGEGLGVGGQEGGSAGSGGGAVGAERGGADRGGADRGGSDPPAAKRRRGVPHDRGSVESMAQDGRWADDGGGADLKDGGGSDGGGSDGGGSDLERQLGVEQLSRDADDGDAQIAAAQTAVCYLLEASLTPPPFSFSPSVTLPCFVLFVFNSFYLCSIVVSHSSQL